MIRVRLNSLGWRFLHHLDQQEVYVVTREGRMLLVEGDWLAEEFFDLVA